MLEIDKNGTKVDFEFNFVSLRLGINFPCMISICVSTNCKTNETEAAEFNVNTDFRSPVNRKLRTSAVLFPHKSNQVDLNVTIITKRGRKSAGVLKFDIEKTLNATTKEFTEPLINCPDKHATITFRVKVNKLVHLSINDNINKSSIQRNKTGASFYSVANYGQDVSTNQSKQLNNSSYSLNINKRDGRSQSPAHNVIFRFQSKKPDVDENLDNWSKQLPSSKDLNSSAKLEDSVIKQTIDYNIRDFDDNNDPYVKVTDAEDIELKISNQFKKDDEAHFPTKLSKDNVISDLNKQIADLAQAKLSMQQKMADLNVEYTIMMKENSKLKEDNAKYHRQLSDYKAIDIDELLANYEIIKGQHERAIKDLDKQEEELFETKRKLEEKTQRIEALEKYASRQSISEFNETSPVKKTKGLSSTWADKLSTLETTVSTIQAKFARMYSINSEEDIKTFDRRLKERIDKEEFLEDKIRGLEQDKLFLETRFEESDKKIEDLETQLKKVQLELDNERLDAHKREIELKSKIANDTEEWEYKFTNLANEYKATIHKLKDNNVNLQKKYEDMLTSLDDYRTKNEKEFKVKLDKYRLKIMNLESLLQHIEDNYGKELNSKTAEIGHLEWSLKDIKERYNDQHTSLNRKIEIITKTKRDKTSNYKGRLENAQMMVWDLEDKLKDEMFEKIIAHKYLEYALEYVEASDSEHIKNLNRIIDTFTTEKEVRKSFWDDYKNSKEEEITELKTKYKRQREDLATELSFVKEKLGEISERSALQKQALKDQRLQYDIIENELINDIKRLADKKRTYKKLFNDVHLEKTDLEENNSTFILSYENMMTALRNECLCLKNGKIELEKTNKLQEAIIQQLKENENRHYLNFQALQQKFADMRSEFASIVYTVKLLILINRKFKNLFSITHKNSNINISKTIELIKCRLVTLNDKVLNTDTITKCYETRVKSLKTESLKLLEDLQAYIDQHNSQLAEDYNKHLSSLEQKLINKELQQNSLVLKFTTYRNKLEEFIERFNSINELLHHNNNVNLDGLTNKLSRIENNCIMNKKQFEDSSVYYNQIKETYNSTIRELESEVQLLTDQVGELNLSLTKKEEEHETTVIELNKKHEESHKQIIDDLTIKHETEINKITKVYEEKLGSVINELTSEIEELKDKRVRKNNEKVIKLHQEISDLKDSYILEIEKLKSEHDNKINEIDKKTNNICYMLTEDLTSRLAVQYDKFNIRASEIKSEHIEVDQSHKKILKKLTKAHKKQMNELENGKNDEINELKIKYDELNETYSERVTTYTEMIDDYKVQTELFEGTLKEIEKENDDLKDKIKLLEQDGSHQSIEFSALLNKKEEELKTYKNTTDQEKASLSSKNTNLEQLIEEFTTNNKQINAKNKLLEVQLAESESLRNEIAEFESNITLLEKQVQEKEQQCAHLAKTNEIYKEENDNKVNELLVKLKDTEDKLNTLTIENNNHIDSLTTLTANNQALVNEIKDLSESSNNNVYVLNGKIIDLESVINNKDTQISDLKDDLENKKQTIHEQKEINEISQKHFVALTTSNSDLNKKISVLENKYRVTEKEFVKSKNDLEAISDAFELLKRDMRNKDGSERDIEQINSQLEDRLKVLNKENNKKSNKIQNLTQALDELKTANESQKTQISTLSENLECKEDHIVQLNCVLEDRNKQIVTENEKSATADKRTKELSLQIETLTSELSSTTNKSRELEEKLRHTIKDLETTRSELTKSQNQVETINTYLSTSNDKIDNLKLKINQLKEENANLQKNVSEQNQQNSQKEQKILLLTTEVENCDKMNKTLNEKIKDLNSQLKDLNTIIETQAKEVNNLTHQVELKQSKIDHLKEILDQDKDKKDEYVMELQGKLDQSKKDIIDLQNNLSEQRVEIGRLEALLDMAIKEKDEVKVQIIQKDALHSENVKKIQNEFENKEVKDKHDITNTNKELSVLQQSMAKLKNDNDKLQTELQNINSVSSNKDKEVKILNEQLSKFKEAATEAENTVQVKNNDIKHLESQLAEKKEHIDKLTTAIKDLERKYTNLEKEFIEYEHKHQTDTDNQERLIKENEMLKQNAKIMENKSVDGKIVGKLTSRLEELEKQLAKNQETAIREKEDLNNVIIKLRDELHQKANSVDIAVYQQIEKAYIDVMGKIGDALNIVKSLKIKQNEKDKIIASLIA